MGYFKPPARPFLSELRYKDQRSATEWEYVNAARVWAENGWMALEVTRTRHGDVQTCDGS